VNVGKLALDPDVITRLVSRGANATCALYAVITSPPYTFKKLIESTVTSAIIIPP